MAALRLDELELGQTGAEIVDPDRGVGMTGGRPEQAAHLSIDYFGEVAEEGPVVAPSVPAPVEPNGT